MNEQSFSFEGGYSAKEATDEELKKRRMEELHRELKEARVCFDEAVIALLGIFLLQPEFYTRKNIGRLKTISGKHRNKFEFV